MIACFDTAKVVVLTIVATAAFVVFTLGVFQFGREWERES